MSAFVRRACMARGPGTEPWSTVAARASGQNMRLPPRPSLSWRWHFTHHRARSSLPMWSCHSGAGCTHHAPSPAQPTLLCLPELHPGELGGGAWRAPLGSFAHQPACPPPTYRLEPRAVPAVAEPGALAPVNILARSQRLLCGGGLGSKCQAQHQEHHSDTPLHAAEFGSRANKVEGWCNGPTSGRSPVQGPAPAVVAATWSLLRAVPDAAAASSFPAGAPPCSL